MAPGCTANGLPCNLMDGCFPGDYYSWQFFTFSNDFERHLFWGMCVINLRWGCILADFAFGVFSTWNCVEPEELLRVGEGQRKFDPQNAAIHRAVCPGSFLDQQRAGSALVGAIRILLAAPGRHIGPCIRNNSIAGFKLCILPGCAALDSGDAEIT